MLDSLDSLVYNSQGKRTSISQVVLSMSDMPHAFCKLKDSEITLTSTLSSRRMRRRREETASEDHVEVEDTLRRDRAGTQVGGGEEIGEKGGDVEANSVIKFKRCAGPCKYVGRTPVFAFWSRISEFS